MLKVDWLRASVGDTSPWSSVCPIRKARKHSHHLTSFVVVPRSFRLRKRLTSPISRWSSCWSGPKTTVGFVVMECSTRKTRELAKRSLSRAVGPLRLVVSQGPRWRPVLVE